MEFPFECIHIAGTNGKGSTATFSGNIIKEAGYTCGVYTSPHVVNPTERISVNGVNIPEEELNALLQKYSRDATFFHAYTDAAFEWFAKNHVQYAVLETGLGGRLDPTNTVAPKVGILTSIGLDHMDILGHDIAGIAREKCGIIKPGMHIVTYAQIPEVMQVIKDACKERNACLTVIEPEDIRITKQDMDGQEFDLCCMGKELRGLTIRLHGTRQPQNAALAAAACMICGMDGEAIRKGLANTQMISRFEYVPGNPPVVLDGAHNVDSALELVHTLERYFAGTPVVLLTAVMADKDVEGIMKLFAIFADDAVTVKVDNTRGADAGMLAQMLGYYGVSAQSMGSVEEAYQKACLLAREKKALLVVSGSFSLTGGVRRLMMK